MSESWLYDEHPAMFRAHPVLFMLLLVSTSDLSASKDWTLLTSNLP